MKLPSDTSDRDLLLAMQSVLVNLKMPDAPSLLRRVLQAGLLESDNPLWADLTRFLSAQSFWQTVQTYTDFHDPNPSLLKFFIRLLITHFERSLHGALPAQLERQVIHYARTTRLCFYRTMDA
ncbi:alkaline phosphatase domain-containing protein (plasmid) [Leptolyngbya sp. NIES-3755]|nr:alkaline phosphatase domain-containing protein [Leptolyngbya sp. NIES-3755]